MPPKEGARQRLRRGREEAAAVVVPEVGPDEPAEAEGHDLGGLSNSYSNPPILLYKWHLSGAKTLYKKTQHFYKKPKMLYKDTQETQNDLQDPQRLLQENLKTTSSFH